MLIVAFGILISWIVWFLSTRIPKSKVGGDVLIAIYKSDGIDDELFQTNIISELRSKFLETNSEVSLIILNNHHSRKVNSSTKKKFLKKTDTDSVLWGKITRERKESEEFYFLEYNSGLRINTNNKKVVDFIQLDLADVKKDVAEIKINDQYKTRKAVIQDLFLYSLYLKVWVSILDDKLETASKYLTIVDSELNNHESNLQAWLVERILKRRLDILRIDFNKNYKNWILSGEREYAERMFEISEKAISIDKHNAQFNNGKAISIVIIDKDFETANGIIKPYSQEIPFISLSLAFVEALQGYYINAIRIYKSSDFENSIDDAVCEQIINFCERYIEMFNDENVYIILWLIYKYGLNDSEIANTYLETFYTNADDGQIVKLKSNISALNI